MRVVLLMVALVFAAAGAEAADPPLARARMLYNAADYDGAIAAAGMARAVRLPWSMPQRTGWNNWCNAARHGRFTPLSSWTKGGGLETFSSIFGVQSEQTQNRLTPT